MTAGIIAFFVIWLAAAFVAGSFIGQFIRTGAAPNEDERATKPEDFARKTQA